jgi:hypothetical protein
VAQRCRGDSHQAGGDNVPGGNEKHQHHGPNPDEHFESGIPAARHPAGAHLAVQAPGAQGQTAEKGCDHGQHRRNLMAQAHGKQASPDDFIAQAGKS